VVDTVVAVVVVDTAAAVAAVAAIATSIRFAGKKILFFQRVSCQTTLSSIATPQELGSTVPTPAGSAKQSINFLPADFLDHSLKNKTKELPDASSKKQVRQVRQEKSQAPSEGQTPRSHLR